MAHLIGAIPAPLHRSVLRIGHRVRIAWWRWRRRCRLGVSIIARDDAGRVLLVRQSYGSGGWHLPGGGMRVGEEPTAAAAREFGEELRCAIADLQLLDVREEHLHGGRHRVHLVVGRLIGAPRPDGREVVEARLFAPDALPADTGRRARKRLALLAR